MPSSHKSYESYILPKYASDALLSTTSDDDSEPEGVKNANAYLKKTSSSSSAITSSASAPLNKYTSIILFFFPFS